VYDGIPGLSASLYTSRYEDSWRQHYLGASYRKTLAGDRSLGMDLNLYRTADTGQSLSGAIDNTTWSLLTSWRQGAHT
ncbi:OprD family outer membrane porin, partial [Salmonella sp. SAL4358]|uniref:OprD family outer membrane porin n=1 Tax=Salmonella sp. SAL4358 TaxID=3159879 RepID=UPI00397B7000